MVGRLLLPLLLLVVTGAWAASDCDVGRGGAGASCDVLVLLVLECSEDCSEPLRWVPEGDTVEDEDDDFCCWSGCGVAAAGLGCGCG